MYTAIVQFLELYKWHLGPANFTRIQRTNHLNQDSSSVYSILWHAAQPQWYNYRQGVNYRTRACNATTADTPTVGHINTHICTRRPS